MTVEYKGSRAVFSDVVGVADAEALLEWLQGKTGASVDLAACTHLHPANLQVLMVAQPAVDAWPTDATLATWLQSAMTAPAT